MRRQIAFWISIACIGVCLSIHAAVVPSKYHIGLARIDVTPEYPIRLSGYGGRTVPSDGVAQRLFAKAMAIGTDKEGPALLITLDNVIMTSEFREELARRLARKGVRSERLAVSLSHSHTTPMLKNACPNLFGSDIPQEELKVIDRYTTELLDKVERVALTALDDRKPSQLALGKGNATFGQNRRPQRGPSDNDVEIVTVSDTKGSLRAVIANYASHCTTLGGDFNKVCGDWAGYAQEFLERDHPGIIAMTTIGCGADQDPQPRTGLEFARQNGQSLTTAVNEALKRQLIPICGALTCKEKRIRLPFDILPTRQQWEDRAKSDNRWLAYHAKKNLARLDRGEKLPTELPYLIQTWGFGTSLGMLFLPGEVVVDYSLRIKKEYDGSRIWVTAYANDVPCYVPSTRIWREGGYEGGDAMIYYDRPTRFAEGTEDLIFDVIHELVPGSFRAGKNSPRNVSN